MAGLEEEAYSDYDLINYDYNVTFQKNPNVESEK